MKVYGGPKDGGELNMLRNWVLFDRTFDDGAGDVLMRRWYVYYRCDLAHPGQTCEHGPQYVFLPPEYDTKEEAIARIKAMGGPERTTEG